MTVSNEIFPVSFPCQDLHFVFWVLPTAVDTIANITVMMGKVIVTMKLYTALQILRAWFCRMLSTLTWPSAVWSTWICSLTLMVLYKRLILHCLALFRTEPIDLKLLDKGMEESLFPLPKMRTLRYREIKRSFSRSHSESASAMEIKHKAPESQFSS